MPKAVIFDFDGVVADSELLHYKALNTIFNQYGVDVPKDEHWDKYLGYDDLENVRAVSRDYDMGLSNDDVAEIVRLKTELFDRLVRNENVIIDGVPEFITMLVRNNLPLAICSGACLADIELMLQGSGLDGCFSAIVAADHVKKSKPDPEGYLLALSQLNKKIGDHIQPDECVVVEDSRWGLEAAAAAGMNSLAVTNTYPAEKLAGLAQIIVSRLDEVTMDDMRTLCAG